MSEEQLDEDNTLRNKFVTLVNEIGLHDPNENDGINLMRVGDSSVSHSPIESEVFIYSEDIYQFFKKLVEEKRICSKPISPEEWEDNAIDEAVEWVINMHYCPI
jgi:hypothetical protein